MLTYVNPWLSMVSGLYKLRPSITMGNLTTLFSRGRRALDGVQPHPHPPHLRARPAGADMATILAIHAHPDDVEILAGGTLALLAGLGHAITIATFTPGDCG